MTHIFKSPKFYKELRMQYGPDKAISDSEENSEAASVRRGSRPQAPSSNPQAPSELSSKLQASSPKQEASSSEGSSEDLRSSKPEVTSSMIREPRNI